MNTEKQKEFLELKTKLLNEIEYREKYKLNENN